MSAEDVWSLSAKRSQNIYRPSIWWLNLLLFLVTALTTTVFGFALAQSFKEDVPFNIDWLFEGYFRLAHLDPQLLSGLWFSLPLLLILLAHEFGHYFACRAWRVDSSLPYFLPSPLLLGTFGAFIRIRTPIYTRKSLFDIGASGPFAGFVVLIPCLASGMWMSHIGHRLAAPGSLSFGTPIVMRLAEWLRFGSVASADIHLHPMAMAAWAGLLATSMNLLPMGQLDGGHIVYAAMGERWHRIIASVAIGALVMLGFIYRAWWIWALAMFLFGRRHPLVYDQTPLHGPRRILSVLAVVLLIVSLAVVPVSSP